MATPRDQALQPVPESGEGEQADRQPPPPPPAAPPPPTPASWNRRYEEPDMQPQRDETVVDVRDMGTQLEENQQRRARDMENHIQEHQEQRARDMENTIQEHQEQRVRDMEQHQEQHTRDIEERQEHHARDLENQLGEEQHHVRDMEEHIESQQEQITRSMEDVENELRRVSRQIQDAVDTHQKALDDLVNINSLFTIATFVGLSIAQPGERSLETRADCEPDNDMGKRLVVSEVIAFAFFLMSSLVAKTLKVHLNIYREEDFKSFSLKIVRGVMLMLSGWGSILGCVFLTTSMIEVIQIKVGRLSCGSTYAFRAVGVLVAIVLLALGIYVPFMMHAIYVSMRKSPV